MLFICWKRTNVLLRSDDVLLNGDFYVLLRSESCKWGTRIDRCFCFPLRTCIEYKLINSLVGSVMAYQKWATGSNPMSGMCNKAKNLAKTLEANKIAMKKFLKHLSFGVEFILQVPPYINSHKISESEAMSIYWFRSCND